MLSTLEYSRSDYYLEVKTIADFEKWSAQRRLRSFRIKVVTQV